MIPLLLLFSNSNAQLFTIFGQDVGFVYLGPRVGMNMSKLTEFAGDSFEKYKFGYQLGAVGEFGFTSRFSIQTELMFFKKGGKDDFSKVKMNYIGLPILAKYAFKAFGLTKVYAMGGTYANVRVGGEVEYDDGSTYSLGSDMKKYEWGLGFGAGAEYPMKGGIAALDFKYYMGVTDIHKNDDYKTRTRSFELVLSYKFDLVDLMFKLKKKHDNNESVNAVDSKDKAKGLKVEE